MKRALPILAVTALAFSTAACDTMGRHGGSQASTSTTAASPATAAASTSATAAAEQTALSPDFVRDIQRRLSQRGYDVGPVDGVFGQSTQTALRNFQKDQNQRSTGQLDEQTLAALNLPATTARGVTPGSQQRSELPGYTPMNRR
jgi:peptidoglycan hydrolase-like protein with peptidoglycan-binding domain